MSISEGQIVDAVDFILHEIDPTGERLKRFVNRVSGLPSGSKCSNYSQFFQAVATRLLQELGLKEFIVSELSIFNAQPLPQKAPDVRRHLIGFCSLSMTLAATVEAKRSKAEGEVFARGRIRARGNEDSKFPDAVLVVRSIPQPTAITYAQKMLF